MSLEADQILVDHQHSPGWDADRCVPRMLRIMDIPLLSLSETFREGIFQEGTFRVGTFHERTFQKWTVREVNFHEGTVQEGTFREGT